LFSIFDAAEAAPNYALRKLPNAELYRTIGIVTPAQAGARARAATLALDARFSVDLLTESTIDFLSGQIGAGAELLQLFDSWAGTLPEQAFARWVIEPTRRIVATLKQRHPHHPIIGFPRGAGLLYERYLVETGVNGIALDTAVPASYARERLQPLAAVQGNLDPVLLVCGGAAFENAVREVRRTLGGGPFVFNLGHGVLPETPPQNVELLAGLLAEPLALS
jgi:uroporphyrinogen decarboxylase